MQHSGVQTRSGDTAGRLRLSDATPWLLDHAYDVWADAGRDLRNGGFFERVGLDGRAVLEPRRVRVQARQVYAFAQAGELGWGGDWRTLVDHGLDYIARRGLDRHGYLRGWIAPDGSGAETAPDLYNQAFYLLALAHAFKVSGEPRHRAVALDVLRKMRRDFSHPMGGFYDTPVSRDKLRANPHMHLLEAALAWIECADADIWRALAQELVTVFRTRLIDARTGALLEYFNADWTPVDVGALAFVEPGHQFEWCWLLIRFQDLCGESGDHHYRTLFELGQRHGVCGRRHVAVDELRRDLTWRKADARLWPQTERLKAAIALAQMSSGAERNGYLAAARDAVAGLGLYFADVRPGLWRDKLSSDGVFVDEPSPASSFYHIVCAISELARSDFSGDRRPAEKGAFALVTPAFR